VSDFTKGVKFADAASKVGVGRGCNFETVRAAHKLAVDNPPGINHKLIALFGRQHVREKPFG